MADAKTVRSTDDGDRESELTRSITGRQLFFYTLLSLIHI